MFERLLIAMDGSEASWHAAEIAHRVAMWSGGQVELVHVVGRARDAEQAERRVRAELAASPLATSQPSVTVVFPAPTTAAAIAARASEVAGTVVVMATHARGRAGALLGSVATDVLDATHGPVMMVGPHVHVAGFGSRRGVVIPADGSALSEVALGLGGASAVALDLQPWVVSVTGPDDPSGGAPADVFDSGYARRLAQELGVRIGREVQFEALHESHVGVEVARFASEVGAALVVASSHGRAGLDRVAHGSVAADIVRHATCPVLVIRPPEVPPPTADRHDISVAHR